FTRPLIQLKFPGGNKTKKLASSDYLVLTLICLFSVFLLYQGMITWLADFTYKQGKNNLRAGATATGISQIETALSLRPNQPLFSDTLSSLYAQLALQYAQA